MKLPPQTEAAFMRQVLQLARLRGWRAAHFRPGMTQRGRWVTPVQADGKGFPDLFLVRGDRAIAAELKRSKREKVTAEQHEWLQAMAEAGIEAAVWTPECWELIEDVLA